MRGSGARVKLISVLLRTDFMIQSQLLHHTRTTRVTHMWGWDPLRSAHCSLYLWNEESGIVSTVLQLVYKLVSSKRKCQCCKEASRHWHCDSLQHANLWGQIHQLRHETCSTQPWPHVTMKTSRTTQMWQMCSYSGLEMTIGCQEIMDVAINEVSSTKYFMLEKAKHVRDCLLSPHDFFKWAFYTLFCLDEQSIR